MESAEITPIRGEDQAVSDLDRRLDELETGLRALAQAEGRRHRQHEDRMERVEGKLDHLIALIKRRSAARK